MHALDLGLMLKGYMAHDNLDDFAHNAPQSVVYRRLAGEITKAAYSTDGTINMVTWQSQSLAFMDTLHLSLLDSVRGFRLAPVNVPIFVCDGEVIGIVSEFQPLPVSGNVAKFTLSHVKTGGLRVFNKDLLRNQSNEAESTFTRDLSNLSTGSSNRAFVDSVLLTDSNSLSVASSGETATAITSTITAAMAELDLKPTSSLVLVVDVKTCANLAAKTDTAGNLAFPNVNAIRGGEIINGVRVFPVDASQLPDEDSDGKFCVLFDADSMLVNRGQLYFSKSDEGSLELSTTPTEEGDLVNLFQVDAMALKAVRTFAVEQIRNGVCQITGVEW